MIVPCLLLSVLCSAQSAAPPLEVATRARRLAAGGQFELALRELDGTLAAHPEDVAALECRAWVRNLVGDHSGAREDGDRALALAPDSVRARLERGYALYKGGDLTAALADYDRAIQLEPGNFMAWGQRGDVRRAREEYTEAIADYDQALTLEPRFLPAWVNRGHVHRAVGRWDDAIRDYARSIDLRPEVNLLEDLANTYLIAGRLDEFIRIADRALALDSQNLDLLVRRGAIALRLGETAAALESFDRAIEEAGRRGESDRVEAVRCMRIWARLLAGEYEPALAGCDELPASSGMGALLRWCVRSRLEGLDAARAELRERRSSLSPEQEELYRPLLDHCLGEEQNPMTWERVAADPLGLVLSAWLARFSTKAGRAEVYELCLVRCVNQGAVSVIFWDVAARLAAESVKAGWRPGLGVEVSEATAGNAGVEVVSLAAEGAARWQGLEIGDRILEVCGAPATTSNWREATVDVRPGQHVLMQLQRGTARLRLQITAGYEPGEIRVPR